MMEQLNNHATIPQLENSDTTKLPQNAYIKIKEHRRNDFCGLRGKDDDNEHTQDSTIDRFGRHAIKARTGGWKSGTLILINQGLATLAFFGVGVNLVLFLTRVLHQSNASAANNVSKWTGTVYIFSLLGAFVSDSYLGRYRTCTLFLIIFVVVSQILTSFALLQTNVPGTG